ncbi:MAG TPA: hypothetical protein VFB82_12870 [Blastocatellia bacterium]|nr:hypothetical protein [Blastocatellia bacterium]
MRIQATSHKHIGRLALLALLAVFLAPPQARAHEEVSIVFHTIPWGMVRGQTARFSMFNPNAPTEPERPFFVQVQLFDASGAVIATSDEIAIPPGEFRSIDFDRNGLPIADNPGGRVQTRALVRYRMFSIVDRSKMIVSMELIDNNAGRTTAVWVTTGFFEVVPSRNGQ